MSERGRRGLLWLPVLWALLLLVVLLAGCGAADVQPFLLGDLPWRNGERNTYAVADRNGTPVGTATYEVTAQGDGWTIRRQIVAQGDDELVVVDVAPSGLRPLRSRMTRTDAAGSETVSATYSAGQVDMQLTTKAAVTTYERTHIPSDALDQRTVLMAARALPLASRYATRFNSFLPVAKLLDRVTLRVVERETVEVPAGRFDTWRIKLDAGDSSTEAWIGVDAPHLLVKFVDGRSGGSFELQEYMPGE